MWLIYVLLVAYQFPHFSHKAKLCPLYLQCFIFLFLQITLFLLNSLCIYLPISITYQGY